MQTNCEYCGWGCPACLKYEGRGEAHLDSGAGGGVGGELLMHLRLQLLVQPPGIGQLRILRPHQTPNVSPNGYPTSVAFAIHSTRFICLSSFYFSALCKGMKEGIQALKEEGGHTSFSVCGTAVTLSCFRTFSCRPSSAQIAFPITFP